MLAPFAWCAALALMFSLIDENCATSSRVLLWADVATCIALAAAPAVPGAWRRSLDADSMSGARIRLVLDLALAGSLILTLVMLATAVPILNACRT